MEANAASELAESFGAYVRFDNTVKLYQIYFGEAWCYVEKEMLAKFTEPEFKQFLISVISHEAEQLARYGGPTWH